MVLGPKNSEQPVGMANTSASATELQAALPGPDCRRGSFDMLFGEIRHLSEPCVWRRVRVSGVCVAGTVGTSLSITTPCRQVATRDIDTLRRTITFV